MEIKFHGNSCFEIKGQKTTIVINPDEEAKDLKADIVLSSLTTPVKPIEGAKFFDWPGEYEVRDIPISGFPVFTKSRSENEESLDAKPTAIFCFKIDNIKICHLGELGHSLKSDQLKEIGDVDILMVQAGASSNLSTKKADEIIENLDPRILIPMGAQMEEFLKSRDLLTAERKDKLTLKTEKDLPENDRLEIVLEKCE
jgi:L-ascorbate metabolism protein UlaG (beta-lactamase superfamily)